MGWCVGCREVEDWNEQHIVYLDVENVEVYIVYD